jgi:hypothetical protein
LHSSPDPLKINLLTNLVLGINADSPKAVTKACRRHIQAQSKQGMLILGSGEGARSSCRFVGQ